MKPKLTVGTIVNVWRCDKDGEPLDDTPLETITIEPDDQINRAENGIIYIDRHPSQFWEFYGIKSQPKS